MTAVRLLHLRRIRRRPLRSALAVVAVATGVSLSVGVLQLVHSAETSIDRYLESLAGPAPLRVVGAAARGGLSDDVVARVDAVPGVAHAVPMVQATTIGEQADGTEAGLVALGVDCRVEALAGVFGCDDAALRAAPMLISTRLQQRLGPDGVIRSDQGRLPMATALANDRLDRINRGRVAVFPLAEAQRLFGRAGRLDVVYVRPERGADLGSLERRLAEAVGPTNEVLRRHDVPPWAALGGPLLPLLGLVCLLALALSGLLVYNIVALSLEERRRDLAVASAVGARPRQVAAGALAEAGVLGTAGGALGSALGVLLVHPLVASLNFVAERAAGTRLGVYIHPAYLLVGLALGGVTAVVAAWAPARRASRLEIASELHGQGKRIEATPHATWRRAALLTAGGLAAVALSFASSADGGLERWQPPVTTAAVVLATVLLFAAAGAATPLVLAAIAVPLRNTGGAGRLGVANLIAQPRRTTTVAVSVGAAVGLAAVLASIIPAARAAVVGPITRTADGRVFVSTVDVNGASNLDAGISPRVLERLRALPGVAGVDREAFIDVGDDQGALGVLASENLTTIPHERLRGRVDPRTLRDDEVIVGAGLARGRRLRPGSTLRLPGPNGLVPFRVVGIWTDSSNNGHAATMSFARLEQIWGPQRVIQVFVRPEPGVSPAELARRIEAARLDPDVYALTPAGYADALADDLRDQMQPFWALQRVMLVVALVATLSTLLLVGVQRRRELGLLAAVGLRPDGLARMTLVEAVGAGLVGSALSAVASVGGVLALSNGASMVVGVRPPFRFDVPTPVLYAAVALVVCIVGAALPAWRTSRLQIVEALRYE